MYNQEFILLCVTLRVHCFVHWSAIKLVSSTKVGIFFSNSMPIKHLLQYVLFFMSLDSRLLVLQIISVTGDTRPDICGL